MRAAAQVRQDTSLSKPLPADVSPSMFVGKHGKIQKRIQSLTGAHVAVHFESLTVNISGRPRNVAAASKLVDKTAQHLLYTGRHLAPKQLVNVLMPELASSKEVELVACSRRAAANPDALPYVLSPADARARQQPGASTSAPSKARQQPAEGDGQPLFLDSAQLDPKVDELLEMGRRIALSHTGRCRSLEVRFHLGKLLLTDIRPSLSLLRRVDTESLLAFRHGRDVKPVFETALTQDLVVQLDKHLTGLGFSPVKQAKVVSLHLESSIPYIQYHPTFTVAPDGALSLDKLEAVGCKPMALTAVAPADQLDWRARFVANVLADEDDDVAQELRRLEPEFRVVNQTQVVVPDSLGSLDLTLSSARIKLKRTYTGKVPVAGRSTGLDVKVGVAAVIDNLGAKRLEVIVSCPDLNARLLKMHETRKELKTDAAMMRKQFVAVTTMLDAVREVVPYVP